MMHGVVLRSKGPFTRSGLRNAPVSLQAQLRNWAAVLAALLTSSLQAPAHAQVRFEPLSSRAFDHREVVAGRLTQVETPDAGKVVCAQAARFLGKDKLEDCAAIGFRKGARPFYAVNYADASSNDEGAFDTRGFSILYTPELIFRVYDQTAICGKFLVAHIQETSKISQINLIVGQIVTQKGLLGKLLYREIYKSCE